MPVQVNVKIREDTKKALKLIALNEDISFQELINKILNKYLEEKENVKD